MKTWRTQHQSKFNVEIPGRPLMNICGQTDNCTCNGSSLTIFCCISGIQYQTTFNESNLMNQKYHIISTNNKFNISVFKEDVNYNTSIMFTNKI